jgi:hypothetical protein
MSSEVHSSQMSSLPAGGRRSQIKQIRRLDVCWTDMIIGHPFWCEHPTALASEQQCKKNDKPGELPEEAFESSRGWDDCIIPTIASRLYVTHILGLLELSF